MPFPPVLVLISTLGEADDSELAIWLRTLPRTSMVLDMGRPSSSRTEPLPMQIAAGECALEDVVSVMPLQCRTVAVGLAMPLIAARQLLEPFVDAGRHERQYRRIRINPFGSLWERNRSALGGGGLGAWCHAEPTVGIVPIRLPIILAKRPDPAYDVEDLGPVRLEALKNALFAINLSFEAIVSELQCQTCEQLQEVWIGGYVFGCLDKTTADDSSPLARGKPVQPILSSHHVILDLSIGDIHVIYTGAQVRKRRLCEAVVSFGLIDKVANVPTEDISGPFVSVPDDNALDWLTIW